MPSSCPHALARCGSLLSYMVFLSMLCVIVSAAVTTFIHACSVAKEVDSVSLLTASLIIITLHAAFFWFDCKIMQT